MGDGVTAAVAPGVEMSRKQGELKEAWVRGAFPGKLAPSRALGSRASFSSWRVG